MTIRELKTDEAKEGMVIYLDRNKSKSFVVKRIIPRGFYNRVVLLKLFKNGNLGKKEVTGSEEEFFIDTANIKIINVLRTEKKQSGLIDYWDFDKEIKKRLKTLRSAGNKRYDYILGKDHETNNVYAVKFSKAYTISKIQINSIKVNENKVKNMPKDKFIENIKIILDNPSKNNFI